VAIHQQAILDDSIQRGVVTHAVAREFFAPQCVCNTMWRNHTKLRTLYRLSNVLRTAIRTRTTGP